MWVGVGENPPFCPILTVSNKTRCLTAKDRVFSLFFTKTPRNDRKINGFPTILVCVFVVERFALQQRMSELMFEMHWFFWRKSLESNFRLASSRCVFLPLTWVLLWKDAEFYELSENYRVELPTITRRPGKVTYVSRSWWKPPILPHFNCFEQDSLSDC
jgi:hypothetical protein